MTNIKAFIERHPVPIYFALPFIISWGGLLLVSGGPSGFPDTKEKFERLLPLFIPVLLAGPSVAGILSTALAYGRAGFRELLSRLFTWRVGIRWYAVAFLTAPLVLTAVLLALSLTSLEFLPGIFAKGEKASLLLMGIVAGLVVGFFEELGWTGFATPRLRLRHGVLTTGLIVGVLWGAWHIFLNAVWVSGAYSRGLSPVLFLTARGFCDLVGLLPAFRVLTVWVYDRTGSLLVAMLMHASLTATTMIVEPLGISGVSLLIYDLLSATAMWVVVAALAVGQRRQFSRQSLRRQERRDITMNILKKQDGMNIFGQGGKIILFMLPSLIAAIGVHTYLPQIAALPESIWFVKPVGYLLLPLGLVLWGTAVVQLVTGFSKGRLVTTGAYGIVRNPIYSSVTFFVLPSVALMTFTWVYFVASVFLYVGVMIFIGKEEKQLTKAFGKEYEDYMARVDRLVPFKRPLTVGRFYSLPSGILAPLLYVGSDIVAAMRWKEYNYTAQSVSELRAIGAPTRPLLVPLLFICTVLEIAFGLGVWRAAGRKRALRITGVLLIGIGIVDLTAPFFPMHLRGAEGTLTDTMHIILTSVTVLLILLIIGFGATADGKWFRLYSLVTLLTLIVTGAWAFSDAPRIAADLPTPWVGVRERINIYGYMLWMAVLATVLLRAQANSLRLEGRERIDHPQTATSRV